MNKNNFQSNKRSLQTLFYKSLLTCWLIMSTPFSLEASQSTTLGWGSSLCTGICVYLGSKFSPSQNKELTEVVPGSKKEVKMLELVVASPVEEGVAPERKEVKMLALTISPEEEGDGHGRELMKLYMTNTSLNKTAVNRLTKDFMPSHNVCFSLDLSGFIGNRTGREVSRVDSFSGSKIFSRMRGLKLLTSLFLLSSIPGVGAKVVDGGELVDEGAIACAACIAGCCTALGVAEGPMCVLHCATGPCAWLCWAPIP